MLQTTPKFSILNQQLIIKLLNLHNNVLFLIMLRIRWMAFLFHVISPMATYVSNWESWKTQDSPSHRSGASVFHVVSHSPRPLHMASLSTRIAWTSLQHGSWFQENQTETPKSLKLNTYTASLLFHIAG